MEVYGEVAWKRMRTGKIMMSLGIVLIGLSLANLLPLDAVQVETYRDHAVWYDLEYHQYDVGGLVGRYDTVALARAAIDAHLGPPPAVNQPPVAEANGPYSGVVGTTIYFYGVGSHDPNGETIAYSWNFGDGTTGISSSPGHSYSTAGVYTVTLTVMDKWLATGTDSSTCTVTSPLIPNPPVVTPPPVIPPIIPIVPPGVPEMYGLKLSTWAGMALLIAGLVIDWREKKEE